MSELEPTALAAEAPPEAPPALPPALAPEPLRPVAAGERVEIIDIVRGMALFGILAANIRGFAGPAAAYFTPHLFWPALPDRLAQAFVDMFIQGKFITIFAVLFGVGFGVQAERALARAGKFNRTWARRCFVLLLFGLVHGLAIWFGDILLVYALTGFLLLAFRRRQDKTILIWAIGFFLLPVVLATAMFTAAQFGHAPSMKPPAMGNLEKTRELFAHGSWLDIEKERMVDAFSHNWAFTPIFMWHVLALFLAGLLLWRKGFFRPTPESLPRYRRWMWWSLAVGILGNGAIVTIRWFFNPPPMPTTALAYLSGILGGVTVPALSLGYVCAVILLVHDERWHARLRRFGNVGRTAFTNYILQSVIGTLLFYSYGLGFFGRIGPAWLLLLTVVIFAIQVALSGWWLERYRFGPLEWVWRRLTYPGPLPMRREATAALPEQAAATP
jgi:uncharacterized protein